jgi:peptidoglycan L-alanyl-D-glutamate endopeptidase CwlK
MIMAYVIGTKSRTKLVGVHPKLVKVVERAIELTRQDFSVLEGVRTVETCYAYFGKGRTVAECKAVGVPAQYAQPKLDKITWLKNPLNSQHCKQKDGYGHAVDLVPAPLDWNNLSAFDAIAKAMFAAAKELGVKIRWGADWDSDGKPRERGESDSPHFELAG